MERAELLAALTAFPDRVAAAARAASDRPVPDGEWGPEQVVRHLIAGGRLLIADFAPHKEEFLRDEFAHRRLGFSDREVEGWFAAAGLGTAGSETIAPQSAGEKLTVKLWLATAKAKSRKEAA